ncbi:hypothetical protein K4F52_005632 [Lecanicillium sp. MT-2017a]|nr:hypothetical protein K4F52_005632 [Lecanicillium sp. MT-2017a]
MSTSVASKLQTFVKDNSASLIAATQSLVQAPSPNPPGDVRQVATAAVQAIQSLVHDSKVFTYESAPGIVNVVAILKGSQPGKRLVFSGHLDTYPAGDLSRWTKEPFSGYISDDGTRLYGRGASDMKGGIAASIFAARALAAQKEAWAGEIVIALAGDEETMGTLGTGSLLQNVPEVSGDAMICGDAGSPNVIRVGEKGLLWVEMEATGLGAHGAHVHRGVNAIDNLLCALRRLKTIEGLPFDADSDVQAVIESAKLVSEPLGGKGEATVLNSITVNIGKIAGGTSTNLVADNASASADIRLPVGVTVDMLTEHIGDLLGGINGLQHRIIRGYDPSWTAPNEEIVRCTLQGAKEVIKDEVVVNMRVGASDARLFRQAGVPSVVVGLTPYNMGGPDEYIEIAELVQLSQIHALAAFQFLRHSGG